MEERSEPANRIARGTRYEKMPSESLARSADNQYQIAVIGAAAEKAARRGVLPTQRSQTKSPN